MEALIFIALIIIIVLLFNLRSNQNETADRNHQVFLSLKKELLQVKEAINQLTLPIAKTPETVKPTDEAVVQWRPQIPAFTEKPVEAPVPIPVAEQPVPAITPAISSATETIPVVKNEAPASRTYQAPEPTESWQQKWLRNNPDLEKFIGENLVNKIGITVLVLGIAFFVKYAIDQDWIGEAGRVSIGLGCGIILIGFAHYLRNSYRSFSSVLAGGGIAVFYFTIAFAFHSYHLFSQTTAFVIMIVITIFAVMLALLYDKIELAVIAAIGGFITPFLVSTGSGNYISLFTYLLILNLGMVVLAFFKKWPAINVIALFFTILIYGGWFISQAAFAETFPYYKNSFAFATSFYLLFLGMNLVYNARTGLPFKAFDFSLLLLLTACYYSAGMTNLRFWNQGEFQGLFTIAMGVLNFCLASYFYRLKTADRRLLYLLIGLTLTFISLAGPIQLHGHTITLFWSAEFVLLYWLHQRSGIPVFKYSSLLIMVCMLISLAMDWSKANDMATNHLPVMYMGLQGFITNIVAVVAFVLYALLLKKAGPDVKFLTGISGKAWSVGMFAMAAMLFYLTCIFGVNLYFYDSLSWHVPNAWHQLITYFFTTLLLWLASRSQQSVNAVIKMLLIAACVVMYQLSIPATIHLREGVLQNNYALVHFLVHWLAAILLLFLLYQAIILYRKNNDQFRHAGNLFVWLINIVLVSFFSVEAMHGYVFATHAVLAEATALQQYAKAGITIVWALYSFTIMWLGMKYKYKVLRVISLVTFSLALVKLFLFDIRNISEGGKIAAFIMLGVLLLIISFMYQKLKKIIIDDTKG